MKTTLGVLNQMQADGVIGAHAIGGAMRATFHLEPVATPQLNVFVRLKPAAGSSLLTLSPICDYLKARGHRIDGEYIKDEPPRPAA